MLKYNSSSESETSNNKNNLVQNSSILVNSVITNSTNIEQLNKDGSPNKKMMVEKKFDVIMIDSDDDDVEVKTIILICSESVFD